MRDLSVRAPAVAGTFYEGTADRLHAQVGACFAENAPTEEKAAFIGAVVPHAGLMYSGGVAAAFYASAVLPRKFVILCPNHTGFGHFAAINREGVWRTPLGDARIDTPLADALIASNELLAVDWQAHAREHSLEVQLPFLQELVGDFTFVPICLATHRLEDCEKIGRAIAGVIRSAGEPIGIIASSDLNHYESQQETLRKDQLAIDRVLALDPAGLWREVEESDISMCGYIPTTTMLFAVRELGATTAKLIRHATSGDVNHDYGHVVGYAAISIS